VWPPSASLLTTKPRRFWVGRRLAASQRDSALSDITDLSASPWCDLITHTDRQFVAVIGCGHVASASDRAPTTAEGFRGPKQVWTALQWSLKGPGCRLAARSKDMGSAAVLVLILLVLLSCGLILLPRYL
jgi:hypothetical protein